MSHALFTILVNMFGGLLVGYSIGFVPVTFQFNAYLSNCTRYTAPAACNALTFAECAWQPLDKGETATVEGKNVTGFCRFPDYKTNDCGLYVGEVDCKSAVEHRDKECFFDHDSGVCRHTSGWTALQQGVFAGMMIIGGMVGSPLATPVMDKLGRKKMLVVIGLVSLIASALMTAGWHDTESFALLVVGRFFVGVAVGFASVLCPMYCGEMAPLHLKNTIGVVFQIAVTFGIVYAAFMGLILDPRTDVEKDASLQTRFQIMNIFCFVFSVAVFPVSLLMPESEEWLEKSAHQDDYRASQMEEAALLQNDDGSFGSKGQLDGLLGPLVIACVLSAAQQLTGINAIMNFAPEITTRVGFHPLTGNFIVMVWNFVTTLGSIPLAKRFPPRKMYIGCAFVASIACLFTGVPTFPGVAEGVTQQVLAGLGILVFVAFFEIGMGPSFYILAQEIFPEKQRALGCSITVAIQFFFNLVINFGFPVAKTAMSGGPSGNQDKGMALSFIIFGVLGLMTVVVLALKMPKTRGELAADDEDKQSPPESYGSADE